MSAPTPGPAPFPRDAIKALLGSLAAMQTFWSWEPRPQLGLAGGAQAFLILTLGRLQRKGQDDYRVTYNAATDAFDATLGGMRYVNVTLRASSIDPSAMPEDVLERVRWGLQTINAQTTLQGITVGLVHLGDTYTYESRGDSRTVMNAAMEIRLVYYAGASPITQAVTPDPNAIVAEVDGGGDITITVDP